MEVYIILTLLGLIIGSFLSVVTYRYLKNESFVLGRSYCDTCKKELRWYDNIPLFSFLFYSGVSRCCNKKISFRYPLIEISTALGFVFLYFFSFAPIYYILFAITLVIFIIDLENQFIPDGLVYILIVLALIYLSLQSFIPYSYLLNGFIASIFLLIIHFLTKGRGMGLGDVKLILPLGIFFENYYILYFLLLSFLTGGIFASILLLSKKAKLKTKVAFGPFIIIGFFITQVLIKNGII